MCVNDLASRRDDASDTPPPAVDWSDCKGLLERASDDMALGQLLKGRCFQMQEAMSAIEIMDPQMDTGMAKPSDAAVTPELPMPGDEMSSELLIGLLDEILCAEHGWYSGLLLSQSVFRLDWVLSASTATCPPLRAALHSAHRAVLAARQLVLLGDIHEEEDFASSISGLRISEMPDAELSAAVQQVEDDFAVQLREAKAARAAFTALAAFSAEKAASGESAAAEAAAAAASSPSRSGSPHTLEEHNRAVALAEGVVCRMRYRRAFVGALVNLTVPDPGTVNNAKRMLAFAQAQLPEMEATVALGTPREEMAGCLGGAAVKRALGLAPAKALEPLDRAAGIRESALLFGQLRAVCAVSDVVDFDGMVRWLDARTGSAQPVPNALVRSAAQLLGVSEDRGGAGLRPPMLTMLWDSLSSYSGLPADNLKQMLALAPVQEFMTECAYSELSRLRLWNLNRGRARRKLRHYLHDWSALQELAETLDGQLHRAGYTTCPALSAPLSPFGSWTLQRTLADMVRFLHLGFELELYAECELPGLYWYLDALHTMSLQQHEEVQHAANEMAAAVAAAAAASAARAAAAKGGKAKKAAKPKPQKPVQVFSAAMQLDISNTHASADMCRAISFLLAGLRRSGLLPEYDAPYNPVRERLRKRFAPFDSLVRPPPLPLEHFDRVLTKLEGHALGDVFSQAGSHFKSARAGFEKLAKAEGVQDHVREGATALARVAVSNAVCIATLAAKPPAAGSTAALSFAAHPAYPVVSIAPPREGAA